MWTGCASQAADYLYGCARMAKIKERSLRQHPAAAVMGDMLLLSLAIIGLVWAVPTIRQDDSGITHMANALLVPGFILLIGAFGGRVAHHLHLPHLTGYLLMGVLIGPESPIHGLSLIQSSDFYYIDFAQDLAIGMIALMAGVDIRMSWLRARLRGILTVVAWQSLVVPFSLMATVLILWDQMPFAAAVADAGMPSWIVALLIGCIALANSPAVVISVIKETRAQGPLSETAMGVSVFKDVVVILGFTIVLAVAVTLSQADSEAGGGVIAEAGLSAILKILMSIVVGVIIGQVMRIFTQRTSFRLSWILVGLATIVAALEPIGIKPLFCLLAAGFACENWGHRDEHGTHRLESALTRVAAPVFILFFVSAGLHLHVHAVIASIAVIGALVAVRALTVFISVRIAAHMSKLEPSVSRNLWAAMIPQAGVSISLAIIIADQFPGWGTELQTLVIAGIAVHELIGPVIFAIALYRAGESRQSG